MCMQPMEKKKKKLNGFTKVSLKIQSFLGYT